MSKKTEKDEDKSPQVIELEKEIARVKRERSRDRAKLVEAQREARRFEGLWREVKGTFDKREKRITTMEKALKSTDEAHQKAEATIFDLQAKLAAVDDHGLLEEADRIIKKQSTCIAELEAEADKDEVAKNETFRVAEAKLAADDAEIQRLMVDEIGYEKRIAELEAKLAAAEHLSEGRRIGWGECAGKLAAMEKAALGYKENAEWLQRSKAELEAKLADYELILKCTLPTKHMHHGHDCIVGDLRERIAELEVDKELYLEERNEFQARANKAEAEVKRLTEHHRNLCDIHCAECDDFECPARMKPSGDGKAGGNASRQPEVEREAVHSPTPPKSPEGSLICDKCGKSGADVRLGSNLYHLKCAPPGTPEGNTLEKCRDCSLGCTIPIKNCPVETSDEEVEWSTKMMVTGSDIVYVHLSEAQKNVAKKDNVIEACQEKYGQMKAEFVAKLAEQRLDTERECVKVTNYRNLVAMKEKSIDKLETKNFQQEGMLASRWAVIQQQEAGIKRLKALLFDMLHQHGWNKQPASKEVCALLGHPIRTSPYADDGCYCREKNKNNPYGLMKQGDLVEFKDGGKSVFYRITTVTQGPMLRCGLAAGSCKTQELVQPEVVLCGNPKFPCDSQVKPSDIGNDPKCMCSTCAHESQQSDDDRGACKACGPAVVNHGTHPCWKSKETPSPKEDEE
jgi:hypothetical protein